MPDELLVLLEELDELDDDELDDEELEDDELDAWPPPTW